MAAFEAGSWVWVPDAEEMFLPGKVVSAFKKGDAGTVKFEASAGLAGGCAWEPGGGAVSQSASDRVARCWGRFSLAGARMRRRQRWRGLGGGATVVGAASPAGERSSNACRRLGRIIAWLPPPALFSLPHPLNNSAPPPPPRPAPAPPACAAHPPHISVQRFQDGEEKALTPAESAKVDPLDQQSLLPIENMVKLNDLNEASILHNLRIRFKKNVIYTAVGAILVSVNPFKLLPIYTPEVMDKYKEKGSRDLPPHVFGVADDAYRSMLG